MRLVFFAIAKKDFKQQIISLLSRLLLVRVQSPSLIFTGGVAQLVERRKTKSV